MAKEDLESLTPELARDLAIMVKWQEFRITTAAQGLLLPPNWSDIYRREMIRQVSFEDRRAIPLVNAQFEADPRIKSNLGPVSLGQRMHTSIFVEMTDDCLAVFARPFTDSVQTLRRVLASENGGARQVDIYSDPVSPGLVHSADGELALNLLGTEISRSFRLLKYTWMTGSEILGYIAIPQVPKASSADYLQTIEAKEALQSAKTDVVVIRPSRNNIGQDIASLASELSSEGFLPLILPFHNANNEAARYFPTDYFREVGSQILCGFPAIVKDILEKVKEGRADSDINGIANRVQKFEFPGGQFVHLDSRKIFMYDNRLLSRRLLLPPALNTWETVELDSREAFLSIDMEPQDLDFLFSLFEGKDGKVHTLAARAFRSRVP